MIATAKLRRRAGQRISSALWGVLVMGAGGLMIATLSGYDIDLQLIAIIVLGALGAWLLLSAALSGLGRQKQVAKATAPVVEEPAPAPNETTLAETKPLPTKAADSKVAETTESLKPDAVTMRPVRKSTPVKSAKPATKKPANKKPAGKESADNGSADKDSTDTTPESPQD